MTKNIVLTAILILPLLFSCHENGINNDDDQSTRNPSQEGAGFTFYTDAKLYQKTEADRKASATSEKFEIKNISRVADTLYIVVEYSATCEAADFEIIWDGITTLSYPPGVNLFVALKANNCTDSGDKVEGTVKIDIDKFIGDFALPRETMFNILNASSDQHGELKGAISSIKG